MNIVLIKIEERGGISLLPFKKSDITKLEKKIKEDKSFATKGKWYKRGKWYAISLDGKHPKAMQIKDMPKKLQRTTRMAINVASNR